MPSIAEVTRATISIREATFHIARYIYICSYGNSTISKYLQMKDSPTRETRKFLVIVDRAELQSVGATFATLEEAVKAYNQIDIETVE